MKKAKSTKPVCPKCGELLKQSLVCSDRWMCSDRDNCKYMVESDGTTTK